MGIEKLSPEMRNIINTLVGTLTMAAKFLSSCGLCRTGGPGGAVQSGVAGIFGELIIGLNRKKT